MTNTHVRLDCTPPFEVGAALAFLTAQALPGSEVVDPANASHTRLFRIPGAGSVAVTVELHSDHVDLRHRNLESDQALALARRVRRWLDLDADPAGIRSRLGTDPLIGTMVTARPGLRVIELPEPFEAAVITVLGQQVSLAAGRTFGTRLVAAFGTAGDGGLRSFPDCEVLASLSALQLQATVGVTHARARALLALSQTWAAGSPMSGDPTAVSRALLAIPGIGPWTAETLAVRAVGDRDAFPAGDLVLRRALGGCSESAARRTAQAWAPYRSYALFHLWSRQLGV